MLQSEEKEQLVTRCSVNGHFTIMTTEHGRPVWVYLDHSVEDGTIIVPALDQPLKVLNLGYNGLSPGGEG